MKAGAGRLELLESVFKGTLQEYIRRMYTHAHTMVRLKAYRRISGDPVDGVSIVTKAHSFFFVVLLFIYFLEYISILSGESASQGNLYTWFFFLSSWGEKKIQKHQKLVG